MRWRERSVKRSIPERVVTKAAVLESWNLKTWILDPGSFQGLSPSSKEEGQPRARKKKLKKAHLSAGSLKSAKSAKTISQN
ncbi:hypothetical protein E2C01_095396 [Portunus trituberculatus]|uniref:Uncharacterized protein n=1 Tax=Portunus trituberculatus TaxID=210409 RepID=A0A5B7JYL5_PORTR|nr:hypothetical protein [Portunus trituberculatus]